MRGAWKPFASTLAIGVATAAFEAWRDPVFHPLLVILLPLATLPFGAVFLAQSSHLVKRGLRELRAPFRIVSDDVGWLGERRIVAQDAAGEWRIRASAGRAARLYVHGPEDKREREMGGVFVPRPIRKPRFLRNVHGGWHPGLALAMMAGSFAASMALAIVAGRSAAFVFAVGLGAGLGWFVAVLMAFSYTSLRGFAGAMAAGVGAGVAFIALDYVAAVRALGGDATLLYPIAGAGALAFSVAWLLPRSRVAATLAALVAGASGLLLPRFFAIATVVLALVAIGGAWRSKPGERWDVAQPDA